MWKKIDAALEVRGGQSGEVEEAGLLSLMVRYFDQCGGWIVHMGREMMSILPRSTYPSPESQAQVYLPGEGLPLAILATLVGGQ